MRMTLRNLLLALLGSVLPFAAAAEAQAPEAASPAKAQPGIWLLSDDDTRIWLFGTIHVLPPGLVWRSAELDRIIADVDELVLETDDTTGILAKPELLGRLIERRDALPVFDRIAPRYHNTLRRLFKGTGLEIADLDRYETWAINLMLITMSDSDFAGDLPDGAVLSGVETELTALFRRDDKPISGVETEIDQLNVFRNASEQSQRELLENLLAESAAAEALEVDNTTLDSWLTGDIAALDGECDEFESLPAESFRRLITDRNRAWTEWLIERMAQPGDVLFAVGACHLAGRTSLQTMLAARGLSAERVH